MCRFSVRILFNEYYGILGFCMSKPAFKPSLAKELNLREAAQTGDLQSVKSLIAEGINVNAIGLKTRRTALHWAAKHKHYRIVESLLRVGADQLLQDKDKKTALDLAEKQKDNDSVIDLLRNQFVMKTKEDYEKMDSEIEPKYLKEINEDNVALAMERLQKKLEMDGHGYFKILKKYMNLVELYAETLLPEVLKVPEKKNEKENQGLCLRILNYLLGTEKQVDQYLEKMTKDNKDTIIQRLQLKDIITHHFSLVHSTFALLNKSRLIYGIPNQCRKVDIPYENKILIMIAGLIIEHVRFNKQLQSQLIKNLEYIKTHVIQDIDQELKKLLSKSLKGLGLKAKSNLDSLKSTLRENFTEVLSNPLGFFDFLDTYFSDRVLQYYDLYSQISKNAHGNTELYTAELMAHSKKYKDAIVPSFVKYFNDIQGLIQKVIIEKDESVIRYGLLLYGENLEKAAVRKEFKKEIKHATDDCISEKKQSFAKFFIISPDNLFGIYMFGQDLLRGTQEVLSNVENFSKDHLKQSAQSLREQFVKNLNIQFGNFESNLVGNFEAVRLKEKQFLKEQEQQKRMKEDEDKNKSEAILFQKRSLDAKLILEQKEKDELKHKICEKICQKKDEKLLKLIINILNTSSLNVLKTEFYACLIKMAIPGSEKIQSNKAKVISNKLTLTMGKFYSFTIHERHGRDNFELIDQNCITDLRKMLESIGINKHNFWENVNKYASNVKANLGSVDNS